MSTEHSDPIIGEIEAFLASSRMAPSAFGRAAANDSRIVFDLRAGRELRRVTRQRIKAFMTGYVSSHPPPNPILKGSCHV